MFFLNRFHVLIWSFCTFFPCNSMPQSGSSGLHGVNPGFNNWCTWCMYICLILLAYTWFWTCVRFDVCLFFPNIFKLFLSFSGSYNFILFKNFLLYIWPLIYLFVLGRDRLLTVYICLKEALFFNFSYKLFLNILYVFITNFEKAVYAHNYKLLWKGLCFNYLISTLWL